MAAAGPVGDPPSAAAAAPSPAPRSRTRGRNKRRGENNPQTATKKRRPEVQQTIDFEKEDEAEENEESQNTGVSGEAEPDTASAMASRLKQSAFGVDDGDAELQQDDGDDGEIQHDDGYNYDDDDLRDEGGRRSKSPSPPKDASSGAASAGGKTDDGSGDDDDDEVTEVVDVKEWPQDGKCGIYLEKKDRACSSDMPCGLHWQFDKDPDHPNDPKKRTFKKDDGGNYLIKTQDGKVRFKMAEEGTLMSERKTTKGNKKKASSAKQKRAVTPLPEIDAEYPSTFQFFERKPLYDDKEIAVVRRGPTIEVFVKAKGRTIEVISNEGNKVKITDNTEMP